MTVDCLSVDCYCDAAACWSLIAVACTHGCRACDTQTSQAGMSQHVCFVLQTAHCFPGNITSSSFCPLQESTHSSLLQQTGISQIQVSSHAGITQRGTLLVIAEAVLAAVVQAEAGTAPMKCKKAAAEVITGVSNADLPLTALLLDAKISWLVCRKHMNKHGTHVRHTVRRAVYVTASQHSHIGVSCSFNSTRYSLGYGASCDSSDGVQDRSSQRQC